MIATLMMLDWKKTTTPLKEHMKEDVRFDNNFIKEQPQVNAYEEFKHQIIVENQLQSLLQHLKVQACRLLFK